MSNVVSLQNDGRNTPERLDYNKSNNWPDLTAQQRVFGQEYSLIGSLKDAMEVAKVGRSKALHWLRDPILDAYVADLQAGYAKAKLITREFVELALLEQYEKANGEVDVPNVTKDGDIIMAPRWNGSVAVQVLREMKPLAGMHKETGVDGHGVSVHINLNDFTGRGVTVEGEVVGTSSTE